MRGKRTLLMAPGASAAIVALAIAGCGSGSDNVKASAPAASMQASAPSGATVDVHTGSLGTYLVDAQGRTLYLFEKDKGTTSMCSGACANVWPPSTTSGRPTAGPKVDRALLGDRLEVVDGLLPVDVDVDGGVRDAVDDVHGPGLLGRGRCRTGGQRGREGQRSAEREGAASHRCS